MSGNPDRDMKELRKYLDRLTEELEFILEHLESNIGNGG